VHVLRGEADPALFHHVPEGVRREDVRRG
jgi:hypothetical protein